jgi:hypothetical protein
VVDAVPPDVDVAALALDDVAFNVACDAAAAPTAFPELADDEPPACT